VSFSEEKVTVLSLQEMKRVGRKIVMLTAYDYPTALILDEVGVDIVLVGDTLGMVVLGYETTLPVTMEDLLRHCQAVRRGVKRALLVADMPFMSFNVSEEKAIENAGRLVKEGGAEAVKVEAGQVTERAIKAISGAGIPVMGHVGLTPQRIHALGGFKVQGRNVEAAREVIEEAKRQEEAGAFAVVVESVPWQVGKVITEELEVPTMGIGAGVYCDGQVLVLHDMLGLFERFLPRFVKRYANLKEEIKKAVLKYKEEVVEGRFPDKEHSYEMPEEEVKKFLG